MKKQPLIEKFDLNFVKNEIDKHSVISFDVFDTLLLRPYVKPSDLFTHLEILFGVGGFREIRVNAEITARKNHPEIEDITFDHIYEEMPHNMQFLKKEEIKLEEKVLVVNPEMKEVYDYAVNNDKKIIITSDMYMSHDFIEKVLKKNGIDSFYKLYVSSEIGKLKSKSLFPYILEELQTKGEDILHIGDNPNSDIKGAVSHNIDAVLYRKVIDVYLSKNPCANYFLSKEKSFEASILVMSLAILSLYSKDLNYWGKLGLEYGGPICYWYAKWIERNLDPDIEDILFVARDGYMLKKIFNIFDHKKIRTHYIHASRQIYSNCMLDDVLSLDNYFVNERCYAIINAFKDLDEQISRDFINIQEDSAKSYVESNYDKFKRLSDFQANEFRKYLENKRILGKKIAVVDLISNQGSAYKLITKYFNEENVFFYSWIIGDELLKKVSKAFSFSIRHDYNHFESKEFLEYIVSAPEPSALRLEKGNAVLRSNLSDEELEKIRIYIKFEHEILRFSEYFEKNFGDLEFNIQEEFIVSYMNTLFEKGSQKDRNEIGKLSVVEKTAGIGKKRAVYPQWSNSLGDLSNNYDIYRILTEKFNDLKLYTNRIIERKLSTMSIHQRVFPQFKNKHSGKDIVIMACGPSVKYFEKPSNDCVYIGVSNAFLFDSVKLDYLFIQDYSGNLSSNIEKLYKLDCVKFFGLTGEVSAPYRTIPEDIAIKAGALRYRTDWENVPDFQTEFAFDLSVQALGDGGTVILPALQFALWTNPDRIFLVGADTINRQYFDGAEKNKFISVDTLANFWKFKQFAYQYYPHVEIISLNPVDLKGLFINKYTDNYLKKYN